MHERFSSLTFTLEVHRRRFVAPTIYLNLNNLEVELLTNALQSKYAIRPSVRSNKKFNRDVVIKTIADVVGPEHPVDLKNYDLIILVDIVQVRLLELLTQPKKEKRRKKTKKHQARLTGTQNLISMSVAGSDYDKLKRFNLAELYNPDPAPRGP